MRLAWLVLANNVAAAWSLNPEAIPQQNSIQKMRHRFRSSSKIRVLEDVEFRNEPNARTRTSRGNSVQEPRFSRIDANSPHLHRRAGLERGDSISIAVKEPVDTYIEAKRTSSGKLTDEAGNRLRLPEGGGDVFADNRGLLRQKSAPKDLQLERSNSGRLYDPLTSKEVRVPGSYVRTLERSQSGHHVDNKIMSEQRMKTVGTAGSLLSIPGAAFAVNAAQGRFEKTLAGVSAGAVTTGLALQALRPAKVSARVSSLTADASKACTNFANGVCQAAINFKNRCSANMEWIAGMCRVRRKPPPRKPDKPLRRIDTPPARTAKHKTKKLDA